MQALSEIFGFGGGRLEERSSSRAVVVPEVANYGLRSRRRARLSPPLKASAARRKGVQPRPGDPKAISEDLP
jgi:hypothetical protein